MPTVAANGTLFRGDDDVEFTPAGFTGTITDWASVPWCATDFAPYGNTAIDHLVQVHNPANGIGDICRYMGVIDSANWRMPTASELDELYRNGLENEGEATIPPGNGGWILGSFHPLSGYALGPNRNIVRIISDIEVSNADPYDNGAVFLPASGDSDGSGLINWIGHSGLYWSSTSHDTINGYYMQFNSTSFLPYWPIPRTYGFSVRCIRE